VANPPGAGQDQWPPSGHDEEHQRRQHQAIRGIHEELYAQQNPAYLAYLRARERADFDAGAEQRAAQMAAMRDATAETAAWMRERSAQWAAARQPDSQQSRDPQNDEAARASWLAEMQAQYYANQYRDQARREQHAAQDEHNRLPPLRSHEQHTTQDSRNQLPSIRSPELGIWHLGTGGRQLDNQQGGSARHNQVLAERQGVAAERAAAEQDRERGGGREG
jgi:hypothetical protein